MKWHELIQNMAEIYRTNIHNHFIVRPYNNNTQHIALHFFYLNSYAHCK
jgi:hypothetical protein